MEKRKTLDSLKIGESGYVHSFYTEDVKLRHRMSEMGITPGIEIKKIKAAPMGDPIEVSLRGYMLSLRRENAEKIFLCNEEDEEGLKCASRNVALDKEEDEAEEKKDEDEYVYTKYTNDDGNIVAVTYGGKNGVATDPYKTFILNYNFFEVTVTYNEKDYTIPAYGYVIIEH